MKYMLMDYVGEAGWPRLPRAEQERWLGAYNAYMEAMAKAGVLQSTTGLEPSSAATTVRVVNDKTQVLDGPYADSKEPLGCFPTTDVPDTGAALSGAARGPTALQGVGGGRPLLERTAHGREYGTAALQPPDGADHAIGRAHV